MYSTDPNTCSPDTQTDLSYHEIFSSPVVRYGMSFVMLTGMTNLPTMVKAAAQFATPFIKRNLSVLKDTVQEYGNAHPNLKHSLKAVNLYDLSALNTQVQNQLMTYPRVQHTIEATNKLFTLSGKVALTTLECLFEMTDFADFGGTKNPETSIEKSYQRLALHNESFAKCCEWMADQTAQFYVQNADSIKKQVEEGIKEYALKTQDDENLHSEASHTNWDPLFNIKTSFFDYSASGLSWFFGFNQELIAQTIKANVLHVLANLGNQAFDPNHRFADQQRNPIGRLWSVVGTCIDQYQQELATIEKLPNNQQSPRYSQLFQTIATDLLAKLFPKGAEDIQLFHHTIPIKWVKEKVWEVINKELPIWLERLYLETRPLSPQEVKAANFELDAYQLAKLPSKLIETFIRKNQGQALDALQPTFENLLKDQKIDSAHNMSLFLVQYVKELFLTKDPILFQMAAFFERYFMEHLLFNLEQFAPMNQDHLLPFIVLQQWSAGNLFNVLQQQLAGVSQAPGSYKGAIDELIQPLGLDQKSTFPLPPSLKEIVWPSIKKFQEESLPLLLAQFLPKWSALKQKTQNKLELDEAFGSDDLTKMLHSVLQDAMEKGIQHLTQISLRQMLHTKLPLHSFSVMQQVELDDQWKNLLAESDALDFFKDFGEEVLESFALQIGLDLVNNYHKDCVLDGLQHLFDDAKLKANQPDSFVAWFVQEVTQACKILSIDGMQDSELELWKNAIDLKNVVQSAKDPQLVLTEKAALDALWPSLEPKFTTLTQQLLQIFGYDHAQKLPVPEKLQSPIWTMLNSTLPRVLFEQGSDFMLPLLEQSLLDKKKVRPLSQQNQLIEEGCHLFAQDVVTHLPKWLDKQLADLLASVAGDLLTTKNQQDIVQVFKPFCQKNPVSEPIWQWIGCYLEGLLLKVIDNLTQKSQVDLDKLKTLAQTTKDQLLSLEEIQEEEKDGILDARRDQRAQLPLAKDSQKIQEILVSFTDQFFEFSGIKVELPLFGVPPVLSKLFVVEMKKRLAQGLLGFYHMDQTIRNHVVTSNPVEVELPTSTVAKAVLSLTRYAFDKAAEELTTQENGQMQSIVKIYKPLKHWLEQQRDSGYQIAGLFHRLIEQQLPTPFLEKMLGLVEMNGIQPYKQQLADWLNPFLTNQVIQTLAPLLVKEQKGQADFDQALLMALLPVLTHHFKYLNQASSKEHGLNFENFVKVAGADLHAAVPKTGTQAEQDLQRQTFFYQKQTDIIFRLIFPEGAKDLAKILPELDLQSENLEPIWQAAQEEVAAQLPKALDSLFKEDFLIELFKGLFETVLESLEQPIKIRAPEVKVGILKEHDQQQVQMDVLVGELVMEVARFIDLPVDHFERLPDWAKKISGLKGMEQSAFEAIGVAMRKQFDGKLLAHSLQRALTNLTAKPPQVDSKRGAAERKYFKNLKELEEEMAEKSVAYVFRLMGAYIEHAVDIFTNPILVGIHKLILAVGSFIVIRFIAGPLHLFKVDRFVFHCLQAFLGHGTEKALSVFSRPDIQENVVYQGVEAVEKVLGNYPA